MKSYDYQTVCLSMLVALMCRGTHVRIFSSNLDHMLGQELCLTQRRLSGSQRTSQAVRSPGPHLFTQTDKYVTSTGPRPPCMMRLLYRGHVLLPYTLSRWYAGDDKIMDIILAAYCSCLKLLGNYTSMCAKYTKETRFHTLKSL